MSAHVVEVARAVTYRALSGLAGANQDHQPGCPGHLHVCEFGATFEIRDQSINLRGVTLRPVGLRKEIINHVETPDPQERKGLIEIREFPWPRIGVHEVNLTARQARQEFRAVGEVKGHPAVRFEVTSSHRLRARVGIDRVEMRIGIHSGQKPGGPDAGSSSELEQAPTRFRSRKDCQQGAGLRLRRHREPKLLGIRIEPFQGIRRAREFEVSTHSDSKRDEDDRQHPSVARATSQAVVPSSKLEQILAHHDGTSKMHAGRVEPHLVGDRGIIRGNQVREHEHLHASRLGHTPGVLS